MYICICALLVTKFVAAFEPDLLFLFYSLFSPSLSPCLRFFFILFFSLLTVFVCLYNFSFSIVPCEIHESIGARDPFDPRFHTSNGTFEGTRRAFRRIESSSS